MSYSIYPSKNGQYIILKVTGDINRKSAMQQNIEAHQMGKRLGISKYLVDMVESRNTDSLVDQYEFAYNDMPGMEVIDKKARVAVVVDKDDHSHDFIETVSFNAGLDLKLFTSFDKAEAHLLRK